MAATYPAPNQTPFSPAQLADLNEQLRKTRSTLNELTTQVANTQNGVAFLTSLIEELKALLSEIKGWKLDIPGLFTPTQSSDNSGLHTARPFTEALSDTSKRHILQSQSSKTTKSCDDRITDEIGVAKTNLDNLQLKIQNVSSSKITAQTAVAE